MQMSIYSDYAIKGLYYLVREDKVLPIEELAAKVETEPQLMEQIIGMLQSGGLVRPDEAGKGVELSVPPETVSILSIIKAVEGTVNINKSLERELSPEDSELDKQLRRIHAYVQRRIELSYDEVTLFDLVQRVSFAEQN